MNQKLILATAAFFAACPSALLAQVTPPSAPSPPTAPLAAPVTLRYKFVAGQVHRYQYNMDMNTLMMTAQTGAGIPMNMTMQMTMKQTVKSVRPTDGAATLVTQIEEMHMLNNGQEAPLPEEQQAKMKQPFSQVMLPTGKILSMDVPAIGGGGMPGMDFSKGMFSGMAFLPTGPVKIGDTWDGTTAAAMAGVSMAFTSTLTGLDQKNGAAMAEIQNKQTGTLDMTLTNGMPAPMKVQGQITGAGSQEFDTTAGVIQSATGSSTIDTTMTFGPSADGTAPAGLPQGMKTQTQMKFTMQRLSDTPPASAAPAK